MENEEKLLTELCEIGNTHLKIKHNAKVIHDAASNILDNIEYNNLTDEDIPVLLKRIDELNLENLNLRNELSYYERYMEFLENNYNFVLKGLKNGKAIFDSLGDSDE